MKDTIYRQAAIDAANRADYRGLTVEDVKKVTDEVVKEIKKLPSAQSDNGYSDGFTDGYKRGLPSAQPEQRWIPSGEKPPEKGSYLVWMPFAPSKHRMTVAEYCGGYWNIKTPISAWMPLPEPYREGEA